MNLTIQGGEKYERMGKNEQTGRGLQKAISGWNKSIAFAYGR